MQLTLNACCTHCTTIYTYLRYLLSYSIKLVSKTSFGYRKRSEKRIRMQKEITFYRFLFLMFVSTICFYIRIILFHSFIYHRIVIAITWKVCQTWFFCNENKCDWKNVWKFVFVFIFLTLFMNMAWFRWYRYVFPKDEFHVDHLGQLFFEHLSISGKRSSNQLCEFHCIEKM